MRCSEIRKQLGIFASADSTPSVRDHLLICSSCRAEAEAQKLLHAGFKSLAQEPVPEVSVGFVARLMRQLDSAALSGDPAREFLERAGRRVLYASLALALTVLVALMTPASSPLRGSSGTEIYPAPHIQADGDLIFDR
jgi:hypothetical protein